MRTSRKFPPFPSAETHHQHLTLQRRRTGRFKHHTERHRKHQKGNMPHLQPQWTTDHHRSQQTDHQFLRRHFQPEQKHPPTLHKALHHTTIRPPRHPRTSHHKGHTRRHQQDCHPFHPTKHLSAKPLHQKKSTRRMRIPVHSTLRTTHN